MCVYQVFLVRFVPRFDERGVVPDFFLGEGLVGHFACVSFDYISKREKIVSIFNSTS